MRQFYQKRKESLMATKERITMKSVAISKKTDKASRGLVFDTHTITAKHFMAVKKTTQLSDSVISDLLMISPKTYQTYKKTGAKINASTKERVVTILNLFEHGIEVFGSTQKFLAWLNTPNFFFDQQPPIDFFHKINGPPFIDDRLTAMEHGDNV
jgi:putative toxin-antitoxin system antitoxin component (TIGR02293 family)